MAENEGGNSTILPKNDNVPQTGNTFSYPSERGSGASTTQIEPTTRSNGKAADRK